MRPEVSDRIALFTATFAASRAQELLGALAPASAVSAQALAEQLATLDSMTRRARAARAFGERVDAPQRVKSLLAEAPALQAELVTKLPPYLAVGARAGRGTAAASCPGRAALLERLIREASR